MEIFTNVATGRGNFSRQHPLDLSTPVTEGWFWSGNLDRESKSALWMDFCWVPIFCLDPTETNFPSQVIQAVTCLSPNVGGHKQPLKGSRFHHPKKGSLHPSWFHDSQFMTGLVAKIPPKTAAIFGCINWSVDTKCGTLSFSWKTSKILVFALTQAYCLSLLAYWQKTVWIHVSEILFQFE